MRHFLHKLLAGYALAAWAVAALIVGLWARFYQLGAIAKPIFDEVYFPVFAKGFLDRQFVFDVHPPLGKFIIAVGIWLFGDVGYGWRIMPALFGVGLIALVIWIWRRYGGGWVGAALLTIFLSLDGLLIAYSRTGLIDIFLSFLILLSFGLAVRAKGFRDVFWVATALGLAASVKWVGLGALVPAGFVLWRRGLLREMLILLPWTYLVYFTVVFAGQLIGRVPHPFGSVFTWEQQALQYQLTLTATHPWSSPWWSWPLLKRPVLFWYEQLGDKTRIITTLGNPALWWLATASVVSGLLLTVRDLARDWRAALRQSPLLPLLVGYFSLWLPFAPIHRVLFLYHYMPSYLFALLLLAVQLELLWKRWPWLVVLVALAVMAVGLYFLPLAVGIPVLTTKIPQYIWVHSWLY